MSDKFICGDCKGINTIRSGNRGSFWMEFLLWNFIIPGIFYSIWRRRKPKKTCIYCGSNFLLPADSPDVHKMLDSISPKIRKL